MMLNFLDIDLFKFYNYFLTMITIFGLQNSYSNLFFAVLFAFINFSAVAKDKSPEPVTWNSYLKEAVFGEDIINDGSHMFSLDTPYRALDAAIVPISINFSTPQSEEYFVKSLTLIVDENPSPLVSKFNRSKLVSTISSCTGENCP